MAKRPAPPASPRHPIDFGAYRETPATVWRPTFGSFAPTYRMTEPIVEGLRAIERADHELAQLAPAQASLLQRMREEALARNAFATASIEGNPLSLSEVESLLKANPTPASTRDRDELEILNYAELMASPAAARAPRDPDGVATLHRALFRDVFDDAGAFKAKQNFIGRKRDRTVVYVPTRPQLVREELSRALRWLHEARDHPPLVRVLLFHHEFEAIHPFRDGNGRTGRAVTPMALHEFGYAGSAYAAIDHCIHEARDVYYEELLRVETSGFADHTPWLEAMVGLTRRAYERALENARFQRALPAEVTARQRTIAEWFARLRQGDADRRVKFNDVHHAFPDIAERTLKRDLAALRDAGVLSVQGVQKGTTYRLAD